MCFNSIKMPQFLTHSFYPRHDEGLKKVAPIIFFFLIQAAVIMSVSHVLQRKYVWHSGKDMKGSPLAGGATPNLGGIKEFVPSGITPSMGSPWETWFWNNPKLGFKVGILFFPVRQHS